jgi:hypothetical protein
LKPASEPWKRGTVPLLIGVVALVAAAVAVFIVWHPWQVGRHDAATSTRGTAAPRAPSQLILPSDLNSRGLNATGIYSDGWVSRKAMLTLAGGDAAVLTIRGEVPSGVAQRLVVVVGGSQVEAQLTPPGPMGLRILVPRSTGDRRIELRFAREVTLKPPDNRSAAARLTSVAVRPVRSAPSSITLPAGLLRPNVIASGIYTDGWVGKRAAVVLEGGGPTELTLRAQIPPPPHSVTQRLRLLVNAQLVLSEQLQPGLANIHALLDASRGVRRVDLQWANAGRLSSADTRTLAARVLAITLKPLRGLAQLRIPAGLTRRDAAYSGIYADGWAQKSVRVFLSGGPAAAFTLKALTAVKMQRVDVFVNAQRVVTSELAVGTDTLHVPIAASSGPRLLELRFAREAPIAANDPRLASVRLEEVAALPVGRSAPAAIDIPTDLGRPALVYTGIYHDGWAQKDVRVVLAAGAATMLTVEARTIATAQRVTVLVAGRLLGGARMPPGDDVVRVHLAASREPRLLELRFARLARIAANDPRPAATLLRKIAITEHRSARASATPQLQAHLSAASEVPAQTGHGSGIFTATITDATLHWRLQVANLSGSVVAAVIRVGAAGQIGPRLLYLCSPCLNDAGGTVRLTTAEVTQIRNGGTYVNVGTAAVPAGEVRGQLTSR